MHSDASISFEPLHHQKHQTSFAQLTKLFEETETSQDHTTWVRGDPPLYGKSLLKPYLSNG